MYAAGYNKFTSRHLDFDAGVRLDLDRVLQGLSFKTQLAVDYATTYVTSINNDYATYEPTWSNVNGKDEIVSLEKHGTDKRTAKQNVGNTSDVQTIFFSGQFDYKRQFGQHHVDATLLAHGYQISTSGEYQQCQFRAASHLQLSKYLLCRPFYGCHPFGQIGRGASSSSLARALCCLATQQRAFYAGN